MSGGSVFDWLINNDRWLQVNIGGSRISGDEVQTLLNKRVSFVSPKFSHENEIQSISQRHDESGDANMRKLDLSMKYFRSRDQIVLMWRSKIHIKQILSD